MVTFSETPRTVRVDSDLSVTVKLFDSSPGFTVPMIYALPGRPVASTPKSRMPPEKAYVAPDSETFDPSKLLRFWIISLMEVDWEVFNPSILLRLWIISLIPGFVLAFSSEIFPRF